MKPTQLLAPRDLSALADALGRATPDTRLIAGGTDLMLRLRDGGLRPDLLIDLSGLRALSFIREEPGLIRIGALTTFGQIQRDATLGRHANCLARAAAHVGSTQIRNVATIGGNVANASPCADAIPALLALNAHVGVLDRNGGIERRPLQNVFAEAGGSTLRPGEAIVEFGFAPLSAAQRSAFGKVGARSSVAVAKLNAALVVQLEGAEQTIVDARIAFGAVAPAAFVDGGVAAMLRGRPFDAGTADEFAEACSSTVSRSIPDRSSLPYKRHAVRGLAYDLWVAIQSAKAPSVDPTPTRTPPELDDRAPEPRTRART